MTEYMNYNKYMYCNYIIIMISNIKEINLLG